MVPYSSLPWYPTDIFLTYPRRPGRPKIRRYEIFCSSLTCSWPMCYDNSSKDTCHHTPYEIFCSSLTSPGLCAMMKVARIHVIIHLTRTCTCSHAVATTNVGPLRWVPLPAPRWEGPTAEARPMGRCILYILNSRCILYNLIHHV